jgi:tetratricopeptide (TPR) repeat protein
MKINHPMAAVLTLLLAGSVQAAGQYCGELKNAYGPFDYRHRAEFADNFHLVESAHFTSDVELGVKGATGQIGGDLDYTLRAIPNHQRALTTLVQLATKNKAVVLAGLKYPVECYFDRAYRFAPDDGTTRAIYANYLFAIGQDQRAFDLLKEAIGLEPDNATINYNLGLAYLRKKNFEQAKLYAKKAYALEFPLQGLKNKLIEAKQWDDKAE